MDPLLKGIKTFKPAGIDDVKEHSYTDRQRYAHLYGGPRWKKHVQPFILRRDPICKRCDKEISELVDHIVPAGVAVQQAKESGKYPLDAWAGFFLKSNLQGLCRPCHAAKTDSDKVHTGPWPDVVETEARAPKKVWRF